MLLARVKSHLFNVLIVTISISFVIFISKYMNEQHSLHKSVKEYFVSVCCTNNLTLHVQATWLVNFQRIVVFFNEHYALFPCSRKSIYLHSYHVTMFFHNEQLNP